MIRLTKFKIYEFLRISAKEFIYLLMFLLHFVLIVFCSALCGKVGSADEAKAFKNSQSERYKDIKDRNDSMKKAVKVGEVAIEMKPSNQIRAWNPLRSKEFKVGYLQVDPCNPEKKLGWQTEAKKASEANMDKKEDESTDLKKEDTAKDDQLINEQPKPKVVAFLDGWPGESACDFAETKLCAELPPSCDFTFLKIQPPSAREENWVEMDTMIVSDSYEFEGAGRLPVTDKLVIESGPIELADYWNIGEYYAAIFRELKKKFGEVTICGHSHGGLMALRGILAMKAEERKGISLILIDPFISDDSILKIGKYLLYIANWILPTYKYDLYNFITFPITLPARILIFLIRKAYEWFKIFMSNLAHDSYKPSLCRPQVWQQILRCQHDQAELWKELEKTPDNSLPIERIAVLANLDGFGSSPSYVKLLEEKIVAKIQKKNDKPFEIQRLPFGHNGFVGTPQSYRWISDGSFIEDTAQL